MTNQMQFLEGRFIGVPIMTLAPTAICS